MAQDLVAAPSDQRRRGHGRLVLQYASNPEEFDPDPGPPGVGNYLRAVFPRAVDRDTQDAPRRDFRDAPCLGSG